MNSRHDDIPVGAFAFDIDEARSLSSVNGSALQELYTYSL